MAEAPVLCFPVSGQERDSFLLEVSSNGSRPLDLKLIGSESTAVFLVKLRHKRIDEYKASPSQCSDEEWQQILTSTFVDLKPVSDIEVRADVQSDGTSVTLSFRKNIQGITQRLGSIKLDENSKTEISPFDWCVSAIASRSKVTDELVAATNKINSLEQSLNELKAQLDDFITAKEEDETQLLEKFRDLLNEKKLKIRQQHRLLAAAKVDPKKLTNTGGGGGQSAHRNAGPSRSGKRKVPIKEEEEEGGCFDKMDIDTPDGGDDASTNSQSGSGSDADENQQLSTDNDVTASEPDTDDEPPTIAETKRKGKSPAGRITKPKASTSKQTTRSSESSKSPTQKPSDVVSDSEDADEKPPPPRSLPFMKTKKAAPPPGPADDDETPSDDDSEL
ncbi:hypothetical protein GGS24DRAFT_481500 [Hypoxylon argillaceum]|nr:hypothetical protein GGS24DRAFT_481500 [Hypoxylon argillaceum]KAI1152586.1 hypothetical protein F4825DRAFT_418422 [Nemania diffusa]